MPTPGKILVTGATGNNGGALIQNLLALGANVRALVHNESKAQGLGEAGVEAITGDCLQPQTLDAAFEGVDKVFLVTPLSLDAAQMASNVIAAARRAGSPHIVRLAEKAPEPVSALRSAAAGSTSRSTPNWKLLVCRIPSCGHASKPIAR